MRLQIQEPITLNAVCDWFAAVQKTGSAVDEVRMSKKVFTRVAKVCNELIFDEKHLFGATLVKDNNLSNTEVEIVGF